MEKSVLWKKKENKPVFSGKAANRYDAWFLMPSGRYAIAREHALLLRLSPNWQKSRVLDVGCGTGNQLLLFSEHGMALGVGIDISEEMLSFAKEKTRASGSRNIFLVKASAEKLPFKENVFTKITSITALEFFENPVRALAEMKRLQAPEYLIAVLNRWSFSSQWRRLKSYFSRNVFRSAQFYSPLALQKIARQAGFSPAEWRFRWRTTLHFFPIYVPFAEKFFRVADTHLTEAKSPFGAFLVLQIRKKGGEL